MGLFRPKPMPAPIAARFPTLISGDAMASIGSSSVGIPASRGSWMGSLQWLHRTIPVKAYPAISTSTDTLLRQVHAGCGQRIQQPRWCARHGVVPETEILKAYESSQPPAHA